MKVYLESIGCRLNQSEIETMGRRLLAAGHEILPAADGAEKVIINSCAVTAEAARDARRLTRRVHRKNPAAEIILTGCYATLSPEELEVLDGVGRVVPNADKDGLVEMLDPAIGEKAADFDREPMLREFLRQQAGNTRAFVKAQDGCNNHCTFCVTTVARGEGQSRHLADVISEIRALSGAGYREVVLTGVHLGSYGHDLGRPDGLGELVRRILEETDIPRLRLSSLEPWDLAPNFFELWSDPRLLPHLHMPLQSGSDRILRLMARRTSRASFRELARAAEEQIAELNLTTDVIVGFPGESEEDFADSLDFVREMGFSRLHVFSYSPRPGTAARAMSGQLPGDVKKERARRMIELGRELGQAYHQRYRGQVLPVLWETPLGVEGEQGRRWAGYTDNYIRVTTTSSLDLFNRIETVRLEDIGAEECVGSLVEN